MGGGQQGLYRDGQGRLVYGRQGDATAQANGYQPVEPQMQSEFEEFLRWKAAQQQGAPQGPQGGVPQSQPQGAVPPPNIQLGGPPGPPQGPLPGQQQMPPQQPPPPRAQPQQPTAMPSVRPVVPEPDFLRRTEQVAAADASGKKRGAAQGQARTEIGQDMSNLHYLESKNKVVMPEIDRALELLNVDRIFDHVLRNGLAGLDPEKRKEVGNFMATGDIMGLQNFIDMMPTAFNMKWPTVEKWIGGDAQRMREMINVIETNIAFDRLQEMRAQSPTGGALGQVSDMENQMLKQSLASLSQYNSPKDLAYGLKKVQTHYDRVQKLTKVDFLMKHKYKVQEGQTDYGSYLSALQSAIIETFGTGPDAQEMIEQLQSIR
jgi:hypothetical protein